MIYSVYFRYWTFFADAANSDVVHITNLNLTRTQLSMKNVINATHREAWKDFLQRVPPTSYVGIRNFMMACIAEGRNFDRSDTLQDGAGRGPPVTCSITMADINNSLKSDYVSMCNVSSEDSAQVQRHKLYMASQLKTATDIMKIQQDKCKGSKSTKHSFKASERHMHMSDFAADHENMEDDLDIKAGSVEIYLHNVGEAYFRWRHILLNAEVSPNVQQWSVLDLVHRRCLYEQKQEASHEVNKVTSGDSHWEPIFKIIHGLPGSGKSKLLLWLRTYFEEVWIIKTCKLGRRGISSWCTYSSR